MLAGYARQGYRIVGTSTSCTHTIKAEYREMLDIHEDDATLVANATWDICEFLLDLHEQGRLDTRFGRLDEDLPYHAPCQLRLAWDRTAGDGSLCAGARAAGGGHGP